MKTIVVRKALEKDAGAIYRMIVELAEYERAPQEVKTTEEGIRNSLFGAQSKTSALVAEIDGAALGYSVYFENYSTWLGRPGIYVEDLYVAEKHRGLGIGTAMLKHLARDAVARGCGRMDWACLRWNKPSMDFYESFGAFPMEEWVTYRLTGDALVRYASSEPL